MTNDSNKTMKLENNSIDMLNFLRVAATVFVFVLHGRSYVEGVDNGFWLFAMLTNFTAWAGVWILFFLSGYLLQKGFLKSRYPIYENGKLRPKALLSFYVKRFMKIAPAYYIYLLLFVVIRGDDYFFSSPLTALKILTFTFNGTGGISGIGHLWYISVAMWFYVLAPFFYHVISKIKSTKGLSVSFAVLTCVGLIIRIVLSYTELSWYDYTYTFLPCNIDLFCGGMLACSLTERISAARKDGKFRTLKLTSLLAFASVFVFNTYVYWKEIYHVYQNIMPTVYIISCAFLLWIFDSELCSRPKPTLSAIKKNPLRLIDRFSPITYAFYIFHIVVFKYVTAVLMLWSAYAGFSVYLRYTIFMILSFVLSLLMGILFTKMISVFGRSKKNA